MLAYRGPREGKVKEFILLMHNDVSAQDAGRGADAWPAYLARLQASGRFEGGSSIGDGICVRRGGEPGEMTVTLGGYIKVRAESLDEVSEFLVGNPVFEAGGTIEIRELPRDRADP